MKKKIVVLYKVILFLVLALFVVGCQTAQKEQEKVIVVPEKEFGMPEIGQSFKARISEIEGKSKKETGKDELLNLALLYSHPLNPRPDYGKSYNLINRYINETPVDKRFEYAEYIKSVLKEIKTLNKKLSDQKKQLKEERKESRQLLEKNNELQKKITSLKRLDIRLEKQRLGVE